MTVQMAGALYHPSFGLMVYGPATEMSSTTNQPSVNMNPFKQEPGLGINPVYNEGLSTGNTTYGVFTPDTAGVSFGNHVQLNPWMLAPSCEWDMLNLPGYEAIGQ